MQHLILHIGRHKTGTTALQYCFSCNADALSEAGIHYPRTGIDWVAHHPIAARINEQKDPFFDPVEDELLSQLLHELSQCGKRHVLISSEGFQSCDPAIVRRVFKDFDIFFPGSCLYFVLQLFYLFFISSLFSVKQR